MSGTPFHLTGKNILITGASSGIGRQCALNCGRMGAGLILLGRDRDRLAETAGLLPADTPRLTYSVDMTDHPRIREVVGEGVRNLGKIHGMVHAAGISTTLPLRAINAEKIHNFMDVNVVGAIELSKVLCKKVHFSEEGGCIIFITSVMSSVGEAGKTIYGMTKGALVAAAKSMAVELARKKIRVNCISPGVVRSPMSESAFYSRSDEAIRTIESLHPLGLGETEDVANAAIYLLSDAGRWVTGANLMVDGGYTAR